jgi:uncharacterized membrane protein
MGVSVFGCKLRLDPAPRLGAESKGRAMNKQRLEAFSDGVIAIIITIMVLELRPPHGADFASLRPLLPTFLSYLLSFIYIGIYWNNHHHLLRAARSVSGTVMWANMHQLFWLSMVPFATAWMGDHPAEAAPVATYGAVLVMNALAYTILSRLLIRHDGPDSPLAEAMGRRLRGDLKGNLSLALYGVAVATAFFVTPLALALYVLVAAIWFIPDRRVERALSHERA